MWVVIHFDPQGGTCPDCERGPVDGDWVVDYMNPSKAGAVGAKLEFEESSDFKYYIGRVA